MSKTIKRLLGRKKNDFESVESFEKWVNLLVNSPDDKTYRNKVIGGYRTLYNGYSDITNEENLTNRLENDSQIRNTLFKGITVLIIGFAIMFVYWLASYLNIPMPVMKVPL